MNASELIFIGIDVDKETLEVAVDDKSMTIVKSGIPWNQNIANAPENA
jgi:hypothetical protein